MKSKSTSKKEKQADRTSANSLRDLEREEISGKESKLRSLSLSDTDEDEDEGVGDGNIHRSDRDLFSK